MSQNDVLTVAQLRDHLAALTLGDPDAADFPVSFDGARICGGAVNYAPIAGQSYVNLAPVRLDHMPGGF